jgi:hypothetical protein
MYIQYFEAAMQDDELEGQVMLPPQPLRAQKGRGAVSNLQGRYEVYGREQFDDGWAHADEDGEPRVWKTHVTDEVAKTILTRNSSPDLPFNVSLNPYRGCELGAFTALRGPRTATWDCLRAWTSRARYLPR